jgi:O-6-methylguanine DNA methyltransferase
MNVLSTPRRVLPGAANPCAWILPVTTTDGEFLAGYSDKGLCRLSFPETRTGRKPVRADDLTPLEVLKWHALTADAIACILAGKELRAVPPLDLSEASTFQQQVWRALCEIKCGSTKSYMEVARAIGKPGAVRAVGNACGANPIPLLIPCHRVVGSRQTLGGFSAGLNWKRLLLAREGSWQNEELLPLSDRKE